MKRNAKLTIGLFLAAQAALVGMLIFSQYRSVGLLGGLEFACELSFRLQKGTFELCFLTGPGAEGRFFLEPLYRGYDEPIHREFWSREPWYGRWSFSHNNDVPDYRTWRVFVPVPALLVPLVLWFGWFCWRQLGPPRKKGAE